MSVAYVSKLSGLIARLCVELRAAQLPLQ